MALPTLIFLFSWLRPCIGIPVGILMFLALAHILVAGERRNWLDSLMPSAEAVNVPALVGLLLMGLLLFWCVLAGQGGFVPQAGDWHWRNALFRDLITHQWPVVYPKYDRALVFYLGHWLPSALIIKMLVAIGLSNAEAWFMGRIVLLTWTYFGMLIVFLQMLLLLRTVGLTKMLIVLAVFVFGDGLDIVGHGMMNLKTLLETGTCESFLLRYWYWVDGFILAHHGALLTCVFHQAIVPWIATLLLADRCPIGSVAFIVSLVLICGPLPSIGIMIIVSFLVVKSIMSRTGDLGEFVRDLFSFENLVGIIVIAPIIAAYLTANPQSGVFGLAWSGKSVMTFFRHYLLFLLVEVGVFFALIWHENRRNVWWYAGVAVMLVCPLITLGEGPDFSMRVSIPAMLVLLMMVTKVLFVYWAEKKWLSFILIILLELGMMGPFTNTEAIFLKLVDRGFGDRSCDDIVTFDRDTTKIKGYCIIYRDVTMNCCCTNFQGRLFYKWLARRNSTMMTNGFAKEGHKGDLP